MEESGGVTAEDFSKEKTLTELMDLALRTNPTTRKFWAEARASAYAYEQSKAPFYPQADLYGALDSIDQAIDLKKGKSNAQNLGYYRTWTKELNISWLLFDFGGREFNMYAFKMAMYSFDWIHAQSVQDVMNAVLTTYYSYLETEALMKAKEQDLKDSAVNLEVAQVRFDAGLGTKVDVLQAQSTLSNTELELEQLRGQVKITLGQFAVALGLPANTELNLKSLPSTLPLMKNDRNLDELVAIAKDCRADLNSFQATYQRSYYEYQRSLAQFWPTFSANFNGQKVNYTQSPIKRTHDYDLTVSVDFPIFTGFHDLYETKKTHELTYAAYEAWAEKDAEVTLDVLTAYYHVEVAQQTLKFSDEFLKFAEQAYELTLESYKVGVSSYTDLLASQVQLSTARSKRIVAITEYISSLSSLAYAAGILAVSDSGVNLQKNLDEVQKEAQELK